MTEENKNLEDCKEQLLRALAELENQRKRFDEQVKNASTYAITNFVEDLIPSIENLYMAIQWAPVDVMEQNEGLNNFLHGVKMTRDGMINVLKNHAVHRFEPEIGEVFDPNMHHANSEIETNEVPDGCIVKVMQPGYNIGKRLIKSANVCVARNFSEEHNCQD